MLRNDGELLEVTSMKHNVHPYLFDREYVTSSDEDITLEDIMYEFYLDKGAQSIIWFYKNTRYPEVKKEIEEVVTNLLNYEHKYDRYDNELKHSIPYVDITIDRNDIVTRYLNLSNALNQEFCRVRYSGAYKSEGNTEIWFRISSVGFNWFNLIWKVVYENRRSIESVSIIYDPQSLNKEQFYKIGDKIAKHLPTEEFIMLKGNPVVESIYKPINKFREGKSIYESIIGNPSWIYSHYRTMYVRERNLI